MMIDSHCHLDVKDFDTDRPEMIERARKAGITRMVTIATQASHFQRVLDLTAQYQEVFCAVGLHPHEAGQQNIQADHLEEWAQHDRVVGIGECGLDCHYSTDHLDAQRQSFAVHLQVAAKTSLPVIVHSRKAPQETLEGIRQAQADHGPISGVLHCFDGSKEFAEELIAIGFYISFSGLVTFRQREDLRQIAAAIPLDRILIETDAPYLSPHPLRGRRNEPSHIIHTLNAIAETRNMDRKTLTHALKVNFSNLFRKAAYEV